MWAQVLVGKLGAGSKVLNFFKLKGLSVFKVLKFFGAAVVLGVAFVAQGQDKKSVSPQARAALGVDSSGEFSLDDSIREQPSAAPFAVAGFHAGNSGAVSTASSRQRQSRSAARSGVDASHGRRANASSEGSLRFADAWGRSVSPVKGLREEVDAQGKSLEGFATNQSRLIAVVEAQNGSLEVLEKKVAAMGERLGLQGSADASSKSAWGVDVRAMASGAGAYVSQHRVAFGAAAATAAALGAAAYNRERLPSVSLTGIRSWLSSKFSK